MADDKFDPDESHFSDEELEAALAGFEKEFADDSVSGDASALWMAVWADMWDFSACIIQSVYRNASGCNPSGNAL